MYFLRWLYREVNPMILILGLVTLYFLLSLATCSKSTDSVVPNTSTTNKQSVVDVAKVEASTEIRKLMSQQRMLRLKIILSRLSWSPMLKYKLLRRLKMSLR